MRILLLSIICIFTLTSCQTFYTTDSAGVATITPNQFKLPPKIGVLKREYINSFDGRGYNIGAGYNYYSPTQKIALTVFIVSTVESNTFVTPPVCRNSLCPVETSIAPKRYPHSNRRFTGATTCVPIKDHIFLSKGGSPYLISS